jgi:hypothetical protein
MQVKESIHQVKKQKKIYQNNCGWDGRQSIVPISAALTQQQ